MPASDLVMTFLVNSVWQVALVLGAAQFGSLILRKSPARYRHRLWVCALLLSVVLPVMGTISFLPSVPHGLTGTVLSPEAFWFRTNAALSEHTIPFALTLSYWVLSLYGTFLAFRLLQFAWACRRTRQLRDSSYSGHFPALVRLIIKRCASAYGITAISVRRSKLTRSPLALGIRRPLILLPEDALQSATESEWISIFSHEMAHVRRHDFLKNLLYEILYMPLSFHPAAIFIRKQIGATRELACDELATEQLIEPARYASSLVSLARTATKRSLPQNPNYSLSIFDSNILEERIMKLLHRRSTSVPRARVLLALAVTALAICGITASALAFKVGGEQTDNSANSPGIDQWHSTVAKVGKNGVSAPRAISDPEPKYPKSARHTKKSGSVVLWCVIGEDGGVQEIKVSKSLGADFDESALAAVRKWRFEPAQKDGKPIAVQINVQVDFRYY